MMDVQLNGFLPRVLHCQRLTMAHAIKDRSQGFRCLAASRKVISRAVARAGMEKMIKAYVAGVRRAACGRHVDSLACCIKVVEGFP